jgi:hypothetical protein
MATEYDFALDQGTTFDKDTLYFVYQDSASQPISLSGWTARMQLRSDARSPVKALELTTDNNGIKLQSVSTGSVEVVITPDQSSALSAVSYAYDIELISPTSKVVRLVQGTITLSREITRDE